MHTTQWRWTNRQRHNCPECIGRYGLDKFEPIGHPHPDCPVTCHTVQRPRACVQNERGVLCCADTCFRYTCRRNTCLDRTPVCCGHMLSTRRRTHTTAQPTPLSRRAGVQAAARRPPQRHGRAADAHACAAGPMLRDTRERALGALQGHVLRHMPQSQCQKGHCSRGHAPQRHMLRAVRDTQRFTVAVCHVIAYKLDVLQRHVPQRHACRRDRAQREALLVRQHMLQTHAARDTRERSSTCCRDMCCRDTCHRDSATRGHCSCGSTCCRDTCCRDTRERSCATAAAHRMRAKRTGHQAKSGWPQ